MKKLQILTVALLVALVSFTGCKKDDPTPPSGDKNFTYLQVLAAASEVYETWENERAIPETIKVGGKDVTFSDFVYAESKLLANLDNVILDDINIPTLTAASNPDRDNYDQAEIAVRKGAADAKGETEDIVNIAKRFTATAESNGQVPNQVLVYRSADNALAFSANRIFVTVARTLDAYAAESSFPAKVSTDYLSASNTLKAFATEFVKYLDIWENTIAPTLSADGSHCTANNSAWEMVHIVPIPYDTPNDYKNEGKDQYDFATVGNPQNITVNGETYTAAQCWEIAIRGLMDMCTTSGQEFLNTMDRNTEIPYGNGKSLMSAPISKPSESCIWGKYPWYESENDGGTVKFNNAKIEEIGIDFMLKCCSWHVTRSFISNSHNTPLGMIGNFQVFGSDPSSSLVMAGYEGEISPMREFLVLARIYKYILDNNINKDVYDAIKDVKFDFELYKQQLPVTVKTKSLSFKATPEAAGTIELDATVAWKASVSEGCTWLHLDKTSGAAGTGITISVTADNNTTEGDSRKASITVASADDSYSKTIAVEQDPYVAPSTGTLKDFAKEFVKALDVWQATVGMVESEGVHNCAKGTEWKNVHLIPIENPAPGYTTAGNQYDNTLYPTKFTVTVNGVTYTSAQAWEIAQRGMLDLVTVEGSAELANFNDNRNHAMTLGNGAAFTEAIPTFNAAGKWGGNPWYEADSDNTTVTYNNEEIKSVGVDFMVKVGAWHVVRSYVKTDCNSPLGNIGNFQQFGTSASTLILDGYVGLISPMREFLVLARFYKYLLDNNIDTNVYTAVQNQKFDFDLYGQEIAGPATLKDFAKEFVKALDVWQATVGMVESEGVHNCAKGTEWKNVHLIPIENPKPGYTTAGNQYDNTLYPNKFTVKVGDVTYTSAQAWEIAQRGMLDLVTVEGSAELANFNDSRNHAMTLGNGAAFTETIPTFNENGTWGANPWYEADSDNTTVTYNNEEIKSVGVDFMVKVGAWHVVRSYVKTDCNSPLGTIGNFQQFGTSASTLNLDGYVGYISPMREFLVLARFYKYLLDNKIDSNVYTAVQNQKFDFDLYGQAK